MSSHSEVTRVHRTFVLAAVGERRIDHVAEVRLQADVEEAEQREKLVLEGLAGRVRDQRRRARAGEEIILLHEAGCKVEVLHGLQRLHGEEKENATGQLPVARARPHPL